MNKTAIKNFAIWARNKLIADISYRASLMGITADGIHSALPQSTGQTEFYDIGTPDPYAITGESITQRRHLVDLIRTKENDTNYKTAYKYVIEEIAYTWFNRLIAVRFMEVNDYLPSHIRVLSSETGKLEPDLVTIPFDAELDFTRDEQQTIIDLKSENKLDDLFRMLFIKQCNALNEILPALFEKTDDYTELLLNLSVIDRDGVVYRLVHEIPEEDFDIERGGQIEIIGWLYQYYNTEPKNAAFAKKGKITKEEIPAVTQLFTPDWIVRYMVENSVGRIWIEHLKALDESADEAALAADFGWKYYLPEPKQEPEVEEKLQDLRKERATLTPDQITMIDPCMGSGHILVCGFSVLMQIYENAGYTKREAAKSILEHNLFGLDIDDRAYQMAYFAVMMKAREYNRRILNGENSCKVYAIQESNGITDAALGDMGANLSDVDHKKALKEINALITKFKDAKEYGSILNIEKRDWELLRRFAVPNAVLGQLSFDMNGAKDAAERLQGIIDIAEVMANRYSVAITNPPYMSNKSMNSTLSNYLNKNYPHTKYDVFAAFIEKCSCLCANRGIFSMITQHSWMAGARYESAREYIYKNGIINMAHLGARAFDEIGGEVVQTVSFCIGIGYPTSYKGKYIKLTEVSGEKAKEKEFFNVNNAFIQKVDTFKKMPSFILGYWVADEVITCIENTNTVEDGIFFRQGMATSDNNRFLRHWPEVNINRIGFSIKDRDEAKSSGLKWFPYNKGGSYRKWYGNNDLVVNWENDGKEMRDYTATLPQGTDVRLKSKEYYFKEGFTWSALANSISVRWCPQGFIFDTKGSMGFPYKPDLVKYFIGLFNSSVAELFLEILAPTLDFNLVSMKKVPMIISDVDTVNELVERCITISKDDWDSSELSWDFNKHPMICGEKRIEVAFEYWRSLCESRYEEIKQNELQLNTIFARIYGLEVNTTVTSESVTIQKPTAQEEVKNLLSYAVGCMFGRYSVDIDGLCYAGDKWDDSVYRRYSPDTDNIIPITDEEYLEDDIIGRLCKWLQIAFDASSVEENLDYIAVNLGGKGDTSREIIRNYFINDFFKDHCAKYNATGASKRPIYWLFDSGKQNGFKALIYLHRYTPDTIGNLRIDYLHRMQRIYESEINRMQDMIDYSTNAREVAQSTKRKEKLTKQLKECREYDEKLAHLALSRIKLDLDDGVKVNYRKIQTANDGKFYEVLADSKNIMAKK